MSVIPAIKTAIINLKKPSTYKEISDEIERGGLYLFTNKDALVSEVRKSLKMHTEGVNILGGSDNIYFRIVSSDGDASLYDSVDNKKIVIQEQEEANSESKKRILCIKSFFSDIKNLFILFIDYIKNVFMFFINHIKNRFIFFIDHIKNNWNVHQVTLTECFWMLLGAFLPIIVDSSIKYTFLNMDLTDAFVANTKSGEVFIFTSALLTPFFFLLIRYFQKSPADEKLPYIGWVLFITLFSLISGLCAFVYYRTGGLLIGKGVQDGFALHLGYKAWIIYFLSLGVWYYSAYMSHKGSANYNLIRDKQAKDLEKSFKDLAG